MKLIKHTLLLFLGLTVTACSSVEEQTPEQVILNTLGALEQAAEARSLSKFMQHISDDYLDHQGNLKDDIKRIVQFQYIRNQRIHILTNIESLEIQGNQATVELDAAMAARAADLDGTLSSLRTNTHHFSILLTTDDQQKEWTVASVAWARGWK